MRRKAVGEAKKRKREEAEREGYLLVGWRKNKRWKVEFVWDQIFWFKYSHPGSGHFRQEHRFVKNSISFNFNSTNTNQFDYN